MQMYSYVQGWHNTTSKKLIFFKSGEKTDCWHITTDGFIYKAVKMMELEITLEVACSPEQKRQSSWRSNQYILMRIREDITTQPTEPNVQAKIKLREYQQPVFVFFLLDAFITVELITHYNYCLNNMLPDFKKYCVRNIFRLLFNVSHRQLKDSSLWVHLIVLAVSCLGSVEM